MSLPMARHSLVSEQVHTHNSIKARRAKARTARRKGPILPILILALGMVNTNPCTIANRWEDGVSGEQALGDYLDRY